MSGCENDKESEEKKLVYNDENVAGTRLRAGGGAGGLLRGMGEGSDHRKRREWKGRGP